MSAAALLRRARATLTDPAQWTKGALARNAEGYGRPTDADDAVCYCLQGAIEVNALECDDGVGIAFGYLRKALIPTCPDIIPVHIYNDAESTTHEDILVLLDRAIVLAESALGGKL